VSKGAEKGFAVGEIDSSEQGKCGLLFPATCRDRRSDGRPAQRADDRIGVKDRAPLGVRRDVVREDRSEIVAGGRKDRRTFSAQKGSDVS
jgi:hypothetical protein